MISSVKVSRVKLVERARGCGYRRPAAGGVGVYLVGLATAVACGRLSYSLHTCPTCGVGVKPSRSWTWIQPRKLFEVDEPAFGATKCRFPRRLCSTCPIGDAAPERAGLLWIGEKFYATAHDFMREATLYGLSRKIAAIPNEFVLGETLVYLAHRCAVVTPDADLAPGIFGCFKPTGIDLVVDSIEAVPDKATNMINGLRAVGEAQVRIVQVERDVDTQSDLFEGDQEDG